MGEGANLADVLELDVEHILDRRLQTCVHKKGLANSPKHARQLIVHGHIVVNNRRVTIPSYIVDRDVEREIDYYEYAPKTITDITGEADTGVEAVNEG
ncbi:small subunit ribosomal protein S4 [Candidatus Methanophagaceae archaeon]|nr:small subunit ribosomal protein S4 [Methanophagales archaeon]